VTTVLDHDAAVPQRDGLLDPTFVATRLGRLLVSDAAAIDSCRQVRVKYRVGVRLRVVHRVDVDGLPFVVAASTFPSLERSERAYEESCARAVASGLLRPVAHDAELATVFWTFPNDRKIAGLPALAEPSDELAGLLDGWSRSELAAYAPEKSATVRCRDHDGRTAGFAKTYAGDEGARALRVHDALSDALGRDDPSLRLPRALAYETRSRTLVLERVHGDTLLSRDAPDPRIGYRRLGRALARLHGLVPPDGTRFTRADPDRLETAARLIGSVRADVSSDVQRLVGELTRRLGDPGRDVVCLHGDVNFRNALVENGRVALIDLDQVCAGPAAAELGSVLAALRSAGVVGLVRGSDVPELCAALLSGYADLRPPPSDDELRIYTAAALVGERALRVLTRVRREGLRRLPALLVAAREVLA
jgi:Ser/Thr protein kinase RdoA (MazF antagonist)